MTRVGPVTDAALVRTYTSDVYDEEGKKLLRPGVPFSYTIVDAELQELATPINVDDFVEQHRDDVLVVYHNPTPLELWPTGFACLIAIPKAALRAAHKAGRPVPPIVHGAVITSPGSAREGEDAGNPPPK